MIRDNISIYKQWFLRYGSARNLNIRKNIRSYARNDQKAKMFRILLTIACLVTSSSAICPLYCDCTPETSETTNCSNKEFTRIPPDIDQNVKNLDLSFNAIFSFPLSAELKNLRLVDASHNNIQIANFTTLENLQEVNLSWNALNEVLIQNLQHLEKLDLSHNAIFSQIDQLKSRSLSYLDLSNTSLNSYKLDFRENLSNLSTLILAHNRNGSIAHLRSNQLQFLDISNCDIKHLRVKDLKFLLALKTLIARGNQNLHVDLNDPGVINLEIADFSNSGVEKIHISGLRNIQKIDFSFNEIKSIGDRSFESNRRLSVLKISSNHINEITPKAFDKNVEMTVLDVSNNSIVSMTWTRSLSVKYFNASYNKIQSLSDIRLKQAKTIDLSHNLIGSISTDLSGFPIVEILNLRHNIIEQVNPMKSRTLEHLLLGFCKIRVLKLQTFAGLPKLQELDLEGNQLKELNYVVLAQAANLRKVTFSGNSWTCDCANEKFKNLFFYLIVNNTLTDPNTLTCNQDRKWTEVCIQPKDKTKLGSEFDSNVFVWLGVFFLAALATGLGLLYCKGRKSPALPENPPPEHARHHPLLRSSSIRRAHSAAEILLHRGTPESPAYQDHPPPSYEEAILMPPLTETERMTRSMEVFLDRSH